MEQRDFNGRVTMQIHHNIAMVTLNRPEKHNAIDLAMFKALDACARFIYRNKKIRAVIVKGAGEDFCSGLDIKSVLASPMAGVRLLFKWWPGQANLAQRVCTRWRQLPVPVIMAIHGRCWGGGLQIALGGDFRIASPDASLSVMENKWGLMPDMGGTLALRELMSVDRAMYLAMTAKELNAEQALQHQLIFEISDDPLQRATDMAEEFSARSPDSIAAIKKLYHKAWHKNDGAILARESLYQIGILAGKNQRIAVRHAKGETHIPFLPR